MKCKAKYQSENEQDFYGNDGYCSSCFAEKTAIAREIDEKFKDRPPAKHKLTIDELPKVPGTDLIDSRSIL